MSPKVDAYPNTRGWVRINPALFYAFVLLIFSGCNSPKEGVVSNSADSSSNNDASSVLTSKQGSISLIEVTDLYCLAIGEYIDTVFTSAKPDTLFIGKHPDFPAIQLPREIQKMKIMLLTSDEAMNKLKYRKTLIYLNVMGWPDELNAEFLIVTFFDGGKPQHNLHLYFSRPTASDEFKRDSLSFEYQYANTIPVEQYLKN